MPPPPTKKVLGDLKRRVPCQLVHVHQLSAGAALEVTRTYHVSLPGAIASETLRI